MIPFLQMLTHISEALHHYITIIWLPAHSFSFTCIRMVEETVTSKSSMLNSYFLFSCPKPDYISTLSTLSKLFACALYFTAINLGFSIHLMA